LLNAISLSAIFVFPRKSSRLNYFLDRRTWLLLAPEARFGELAGTIQGTVDRQFRDSTSSAQPCVDPPKP
jgi:hypothetical protein